MYLHWVLKSTSAVVGIRFYRWRVEHLTKQYSCLLCLLTQSNDICRQALTEAVRRHLIISHTYSLVDRSGNQEGWRIFLVEHHVGGHYPAATRHHLPVSGMSAKKTKIVHVFAYYCTSDENARSVCRGRILTKKYRSQACVSHDQHLKSEYSLIAKCNWISQVAQSYHPRRLTWRLKCNS